jgi:hypothetical protein
MATITVNTTNISGGDSFIDRNDILTPINDITNEVNNILNGVQEADALLLKGVMTPSNPAANHLKVYVDTADGKLKRVNSSGTVVDLEATGGASGTLNDLTDVDTAGVANGDVLTYNAGTWEAAAPTGGVNGPSADYIADESANWTTTSTSFVDIDAVKLSLEITTTGRDLLLGFFGNFIMNGAAAMHLTVTMDGVAIALDDGIVGARNLQTSAPGNPISFVHLLTGISAGVHTFKLRWKVSSGTLTLYAGAGTASGDLHPQFWVKEL